MTETAALLQEPLPESPHPLSPSAEKYWPMIVGAKLPTLWTEIDLEAAWGLAEDLAALEAARLTLQSEPQFYTAADGRIREHPAVKAVDQLEKRVLTLKRSLQIHSIATNGPTHHQGGKNKAARQIAKGMKSAQEDDLIARPN